MERGTDCRTCTCTPWSSCTLQHKGSETEKLLADNWQPALGVHAIAIVQKSLQATVHATGQREQSQRLSMKTA